MIKNEVFSIKIGGQAGQGIKSAGLLLARFVTRSGYNVYNYIEYPSLIRGGHNVMQINISGSFVAGPSLKTDFLIALNQDTLNKHISELTINSGILCDSSDKMDFSKLPSNVKLFQVPLSKLAKNSGGKDLLSNTVALGAVAALFGGDLTILRDLIKDEYSRKGDKAVESDIKAVEYGYNYVLDNFSEKLSTLFRHVDRVTQMVLNGNEAVALGAISAGMQFAAIYPMSPISNILQVLAANQIKYDYVYKQPEDEISAINMAIGAAFAGARSMAATSGGGFCLMTEGYGLAGMTETPLVIVEGMRGAPATGLPTWSEQGDLQFVLHAHQGDFPRIVLAAGDVNEAFYLTMEAFHLADKYQTPVVLLIDKNICDHEQSVPVFDISFYKIDRGNFTTHKELDYKRYNFFENGISLRTVPGSGNFFISNSDEHDAYGFSNEEIENRNNQMLKRMTKLATCAKTDMPLPLLYGPKNADLTIVSWGSNKGSILQTLKEFDNVNYLHITWMSPFPADEVKKILDKSKHILDIECNYTGQFASLVQEKTGIEISNKLLKCDGRPFYVEDIVNKINAILKANK